MFDYNTIIHFQAGPGNYDSVQWTLAAGKVGAGTSAGLILDSGSYRVELASGREILDRVDFSVCAPAWTAGAFIPRMESEAVDRVPLSPGLYVPAFVNLAIVPVSAVIREKGPGEGSTSIDFGSPARATAIEHGTPIRRPSGRDISLARSMPFRGAYRGRANPGFSSGPLGSSAIAVGSRRTFSVPDPANGGTTVHFVPAFALRVDESSRALARRMRHDEHWGCGFSVASGPANPLSLRLALGPLGGY